jgi:hypothetical protein
METDGLAIHRRVGGRLDHTYWRLACDHRMVPIRTISGSLPVTLLQFTLH